MNFVIIGDKSEGLELMQPYCNITNDAVKRFIDQHMRHAVCLGKVQNTKCHQFVAKTSYIPNWVTDLW